MSLCVGLGRLRAFNEVDSHMTDRKMTGELERIGPGGREIMVLGVEAPGFEDLTARQKEFAYYLYRAAIPGNRIAYEQSHRHAYEIKTLLECIHLHPDGLSQETRDAVHDYLKFIWVHHGQYDHYSHTKFVPYDLTPDMLRAACERAAANGARIPAVDGESLDAMLARLEASIFDPDFEPIQTNQSEGDDIVATSAVNYYAPGVTHADLGTLEPQVRHKLNVRFDHVDGRVVPQPYRIGGLYSDELETISHFLTLALSCAQSDLERQSIESLLEFYRTGEEEAFRRHMIEWLKIDGDIDYLNGFIEVYLDPRGVIGQFEANVSFRAGGGLIDGISANAVYFEKRMPWPDEYKRSEVVTPVANVVNVLIETGDAGPVSPAAYNLPNYNDIRRDHGSKNVILHNVENTWSRELMQEQVDEFYLPEYRERVMEYFQPLIRPLEVYMHEIIGHGAGRPADSLDGDPRTLLGRTYSALEECRADLVALYHMADPKLVEIGAFTLAQQRDIVETTYVTYLQNWFSRLDRVPGFEVREAHEKGHHTILNYIIEGGGDPEVDFGAELIERDGDYFVRVYDLEAMRNGIAELLSTIQTIKSNGNSAAAEALFDRFGTKLNPDWKTNVETRRARLNSPKIKAFVFPHLVPFLEDGKLTDVSLRYDEDLTTQQLRLSRLELSRDLAAD